jgi:hypothetical protein
LRLVPRGAHGLRRERPRDDETTKTLTNVKTMLEPRPTTTSASATPTDWHRRQRELVAASLVAVPGVKRPTHRRWV